MQKVKHHFEILLMEPLLPILILLNFYLRGSKWAMLPVETPSNATFVFTQKLEPNPTALSIKYGQVNSKF